MEGGGGDAIVKNGWCLCMCQELCIKIVETSPNMGAGERVARRVHPHTSATVSNSIQWKYPYNISA